MTRKRFWWTLGTRTNWKTDLFCKEANDFVVVDIPPRLQTGFLDYFETLLHKNRSNVVTSKHKNMLHLCSHVNWGDSKLIINCTVHRITNMEEKKKRVSISFVFPFFLFFFEIAFQLFSFLFLDHLKIDFYRNFPTNSIENRRRLPHQRIKSAERSKNLLRGFAASLGSGNTFTNLLKTNFLANSLDQTQLAHTQNTHTQNLLSDQFSRPTTLAGGKSRAHTLVPAGMSVAAALNINLSSLGPFGGYIGASHSKETNSSARVSRAASPSLGSSAENNRFNWKRFFLFFFLSFWHFAHQFCWFLIHFHGVF